MDPYLGLATAMTRRWCRAQEDLAVAIGFYAPCDGAIALVRYQARPNPLIGLCLGTPRAAM
jgi:hypothetical protein